ncbi:hypothetical protein [Streptomyces sp. OE57]|uniref:hypothetical protein n=1 Tax=Streptomyces lacaronensis TaxID=3379885 RepID=UPI0039B768EA
MSIQPDEDELQTRDRLLALGVSYAPVPGDAPAREPGEEDHLEHAAPAAEEEAAVPAPRRSTLRLPDWWSPHKPDLSVEEPAEEPEDVGEDDQEEPEEDSGRPGVRGRVSTWKDAVTSRRRPAADAGDRGDTEDDVPGDAEDAGDAGEDDEEDGGDTAGDRGPRPGGPVSKRPPAPRGKGRPAGRAQKPSHWHRLSGARLPVPMRGAEERRSLVDVVRSTPGHVKWMLFSGSALGAGFYLGWPQWVRDGAEFLVTEHPSLTDTYSFTCYGLAVGVFVLDSRASGLLDRRRGRWLLLPIAWLARIPSVSLVVGVCMHGDPTPISQMF